MWTRMKTTAAILNSKSPLLQLATRRLSTGPGKRVAAVWGNGDYGRLGLGRLDSQWSPTPLLCSAFRDQTLQAIACGGAHTLFLTDAGRVFATGLNDFGQLGVSSDVPYSTELVEVSGIDKQVVQISAGYYHSSAVTEDGELYMWGKNSNGQLGLGKRGAKAVAVPTKVECLAGMTIRMVALGSEHSVAVTDGGESLSWGEGSGRLGHAPESGILGIFRSNSEYTPRLIKKLEGTKVIKVAAGLLHSACVDENGSVFVFGERAVDKMTGASSVHRVKFTRLTWQHHNRSFQLKSKVRLKGEAVMLPRQPGEISPGGLKNFHVQGSAKEKNDGTAPSMISELPFSEEVSCGGYHTCAITSGGELYSWGSNENGCLGIGTTDVFHLPERVQGPFLKSAVVKVSCGWKHTAAISGGNIFTWGWGGSHGTFSEEGHSSGGQLGHGTDVDYIKPTRVKFGENLKALQISCGFNHTGAILEYS